MGKTVGLAGAGSIAFGTAAVLHKAGRDPMLWSPSGDGTSGLSGGASLRAVGALETTFSPRIASDAATLARENDVLIIAGKGHEATQEIDGHKFPFNDFDVVLELIAQSHEREGELTR